MDALLIACKLGDYPTVVRLIESGADANVQTETAVSALMWAVVRGNPQVVQVLIDNGANINHIDNSGKTPLWLAENFGHRDIAEMLKQRLAE